MNQHSGHLPRSSAPHGLAVALVCATFPLIWVGGLVTTYEAGMSVPDWPGTYGYNLLLYPWRTWVFGPWDLFIEHGHRLLGALAGLLSIGLLVVVWRYDERGWMRALAVGVLLAVVAQGLLGGLRVLGDDDRLAMIHGCTGPLFFALCVSMAVLTSRDWLDTSRQTRHQRAASLHRLAWLTFGLAVFQLVLGAQLRHVAVVAQPQTFRVLVWFHLLVAAALITHACWLGVHVARFHRQQRGLVRPAVGLAVIVLLQTLLGMGTWLVLYSWPTWLPAVEWAAGMTIQAEGAVQVLTVTAHVATGAADSGGQRHVGAAISPPGAARGRACRAGNGLLGSDAMTMTTWAVSQSRAHGLARARDYLELTKPKILVLVLATVAVAGYVARWGRPDVVMLAHALLGTAWIAASASAANQWLERHSDALMQRTGRRPLPAGRLSGREVLVFSGLAVLAGVTYLAVAVGWLTALLGWLTWMLYVMVYTPLKSRTAWNTAVGAVAGAMPVTIGWSAADGDWGIRAASLFLIVFFWQFPHFMSIAWIYRQQYAKAGLKMLTVVDPSGRWAGIQAVATALVLLPVSTVPGWATSGTLVYVAAALLLGAGQLACAALFLRHQQENSARRLLRASLLYLPALLLLMVLLPWM